MSLPNLTEQILAANRAWLSAEEEERQRKAREHLQRASANARDTGPTVRQRILQVLADGRAHSFADILAALGDVRQGRIAWCLGDLVDRDRVERIGEKKPFRYRIA